MFSVPPSKLFYFQYTADKILFIVGTLKFIFWRPSHTEANLHWFCDLSIGECTQYSFLLALLNCTIYYFTLLLHITFPRGIYQLVDFQLLSIIYKIFPQYFLFLLKKHLKYSSIISNSLKLLFVANFSVGCLPMFLISRVHNFLIHLHLFF